MFKKFGELKEGDPVFAVDIDYNICNFTKYYIIKFDDKYSTKERLYSYLNSSPLSFDFGREDSSWHGIIFSTEEEAKQKAKKELLNYIDNFENKLKKYKDLIENIDNIEFK